jgi:hypothetical protein
VRADAAQVVQDANLVLTIIFTLEAVIKLVRAVTRRRLRLPTFWMELSFTLTSSQNAKRQTPNAKPPP